MNNRPIIYLFSGLGADARVFEYLNFQNATTKVIEWIRPEKKETLKEYCIRLSQQVNTNENFVFVGVSFRGVVAQELAKLIAPQKIILISTVTSSKEFDWKLRLLKLIPIYKVVPNVILKKIGLLFGGYAFTVKNQHKKLFNQIIKDTDFDFMKWAITALVKWNGSIIQPTARFHGTYDRLFPVSKVGKCEKLESGHFMIVDEAKALNCRLAEILQE